MASTTALPSSPAFATAATAAAAAARCATSIPLSKAVVVSAVRQPRSSSSRRPHTRGGAFAPLRAAPLPSSTSCRSTGVPSLILSGRRNAPAWKQGSGAGGRMVVKCQAVSEAQREGTGVRVEFVFDKPVGFGESLAIVGSADGLGNWELANAPRMAWDDKQWTLVLCLPPGQDVYFKFVLIRRDGSVDWEPGSDHKLTPSQDGQKYVAEWVPGEKSGADDNEEGDKQERRRKRKEEEERQRQENKAQQDGSNGSNASGNGDWAANGNLEKAAVAAVGGEVDRSAAGNWQGRKIDFMRSNDHARDRSAVWDDSIVDSPAGKAIVRGDKDSGSWRKKLHVVAGLLALQPGEFPDADALAYSSVYLRWIGTGAIPCVEDGGHHRPNAHAETSRRIFRTIEWVIGSPTSTPEAVLAARRIHPQLPSFSAEFTASVPLTRIRDIAHRNDIPHDLKQEIKHTIQNKLHRNAGPEDLVATELMLRRVTNNPGEYPEAFVNEFKTFYGELQDFFNAVGLVDRLNQLRPALDSAAWSMVETFVARKNEMEGARKDNKDSIDAVLQALHAATGVRAVIVSNLSSGLRNDAPDDSISMRQRFRLAEIGLEEFAFTLLSRLLNALDSNGGSNAIAEQASKGVDSIWNAPLGAAVLALRHLGLSGWQSAECLCIERELQAWQEGGALAGVQADYSNTLRLKSTLDRARRLASGYTDALLELYSAKAASLGKALGIPPDMASVFVEAEVRAGVVFQLAKVTSTLIKAAQKVASLPPWDVLVMGEAGGKLIEVDNFSVETIPPASQGPVIVLVRHAEGDEEVRAAGDHVGALILCHELPHLSHLGVRARQEKVPLVTCEDEGILSNLRSLVGKNVTLLASADDVKVAEGSWEAKSSTPAASSSSPSSSSPAGPLKVTLGKEGAAAAVLDLQDVVSSNGGAKSAACGELARICLGGSEGVFFKVPLGVCLPFGSMEEAIKQAGKHDEFSALVASLDSITSPSELEAACEKVRAIVSSVRPPQSIAESVAKAFPAGTAVIARSSANVEDLAGMSGAGLYDSIPNVKLDPTGGYENFGQAVAEVWASLYTRRAVLSRKAAGVKQEDACMAVLIQELLAPELSFVLHTASPLDGDRNKLYAEIAVGLGETLASGTRGTPWRLLVDKTTEKTSTLAFANFSEAIVAPSTSLTSSQSTTLSTSPSPSPSPSLPRALSYSSSSSSSDPTLSGGRVTKVRVDYSKQRLTLNHEVREDLGKKLLAVGKKLEEAFDSPQDIEGGVVGGEIYIVQSRPQPL